MFAIFMKNFPFELELRVKLERATGLTWTRQHLSLSSLEALVSFLHRCSAAVPVRSSPEALHSPRLSLRGIRLWTCSCTTSFSRQSSAVGSALQMMQEVSSLHGRYHGAGRMLLATTLVWVVTTGSCTIFISRLGQFRGFLLDGELPWKPNEARKYCYSPGVQVFLPGWLLTGGSPLRIGRSRRGLWRGRSRTQQPRASGFAVLQHSWGWRSYQNRLPTQASLPKDTNVPRCRISSGHSHPLAVISTWHNDAAALMQTWQIQTRVWK